MYCQITFSDNILNISIIFKNPVHATANNHMQRNLTPLRSTYMWGGSRPRFEPERGDLRYRDDPGRQPRPSPLLPPHQIYGGTPYVLR